MKSYMRTLGIVGICLFLLSTAVLAETKYYINDSMKVTMRTGPATDRKIIALLSVGQEVEILKAEDEFRLNIKSRIMKQWNIGMSKIPALPGLECWV